MSEGPKSIKLQTAIRTKVSGDTGENRIVAVSYGDLSYSDLESVYQRLSVGNLPRPSESGSEAPPWLTIGCIDFNRVLYIAVVKQDWTERIDGRGYRPVSTAICVCTRFEGFAALGGQYSDLVDRTRSIDVNSLDLSGMTFVLDSDPVVQSGTADGIVRSVDIGFGFEVCAIVAALLLEKRVALVDATDVNWHTRVAFFDAVFSLLPYGLRANTSLSSWMQNSTHHSMRLGFSDSAGQSQVRIKWGQVSASSLVSGSCSYRYYTRLCMLASNHELKSILTSLQNGVAPIDYSESEEILKVLTDIDRVSILVEETGNNTARPDEVRSFMRSANPNQLLERQRNTLYSYLLSQHSPEDVTLIAQYLDSTGRDKIIQNILNIIESESPDMGLLTLLVRVVFESSDLPRLVRRLVDHFYGDPVFDSAVATQIAQMFADYPSATPDLLRLLGDEQRSRKSLPIDIVLRSAPGTSKKSLVTILQSQSRQPDIEATITAVEIALGVKTAREMTVSDIDSVVKMNANYPRQLLALACAHQTADVLVPALAGWAVRNSEQFAGSDKKLWDALLSDKALGSSRMPMTHAYADALAFALDQHAAGTSRFLTQYLPAETVKFELYSKCFSSALANARSAKVLIAQKSVQTAFMSAKQPHADIRTLENLLSFVDRIATDLPIYSDFEALSTGLLSLFRDNPTLLEGNRVTQTIKNKMYASTNSLSFRMLELTQRLSHCTSVEAGVECAQAICQDSSKRVSFVVEALLKRPDLLTSTHLADLWWGFRSTLLRSMRTNDAAGVESRFIADFCKAVRDNGMTDGVMQDVIKFLLICSESNLRVAREIFQFLATNGTDTTRDSVEKMVNDFHKASLPDRPKKSLFRYR